MNLDTTHEFPEDYDPPNCPDGECSPERLADAILHWLDFRKQHPIRNAPPVPTISDQGLRRLIDLAFYTSLHPEEGFYPSLRLVYQANSNGYWRSLANFDPINLEGVDTLRRLSPICKHHDRALFVEEKDGGLWCNGVMCIGPIGYEEQPGSPAITRAGFPPSLRIELKGPGHLSVAAVGVGYELRAGHLRARTMFFGIQPLERLTKTIISYLTNEIARWGGHQAFYAAFGSYRVWSPFPTLLCGMLQAALDGGHGGAFVILPTDQRTVDDFDIHVKYRAKDLDLATRMIRFWVHCIECHEKIGSPQYPEAVRVWNTELRKLYADAEALGELSQVDGCVVLNHYLQLCGFGAEIRVGDDQARRAQRSFVSHVQPTHWDYDGFMRSIGGTRHRSAARLAKAHEGVTAFVVSEDKEVRVFSSTSHEVNCYGPLDLPFREEQKHLRLA